MAVLNEEQTMLRDMARDWARAEAPVTAFRKLRDSGSITGYDPHAWGAVAEMGWTGVIIPEAHGGSDFGYLSLGLILEELGKTLAATPLAASAVTASALVLGGDEDQKALWLPRLADGSIIGTLAVDEGPRHAPDAIATTATPTDGGWVLNGLKTFVPEGDGAGLFIIAARTPDGPALFLVPGDADGVTRISRTMVDSRSHADLRLTDVSLGSAALLGDPAKGSTLLTSVLDRARVAAAAEMLGMAVGAFDTTLDYMKVRVQFGQTIGSFQALQHRAAELFTQIELTRSSVEAALEAIDAGRADIDQMASLAKATASDTIHLVSREMIQLHGGIGMTDEYDAGFYIKRARVLENAWGNAGFHRERFARLNGY